MCTFKLELQRVSKSVFSFSFLTCAILSALNILWIGTCYDTEHGFALGNWADWWHHQPSMPRSAKPSICPLFSLLVSSSCHCSLLGFVCLLFPPTLVFCCLVSWIQNDNFGFQQNFMLSGKNFFVAVLGDILSQQAHAKLHGKNSFLNIVLRPCLLPL